MTFRIAGLTNPILKPWAIDQMREQNEPAAAGKRAYEARASCRPEGVPGFLVMGRVNPLFFVQGKNEVLLINESGPGVRRVLLTVPHSAHPKSSPYGESIEHHEGGDTLVVDTSACRTMPTSTVTVRRTRRSFTSSSASSLLKAARHCRFLRVEGPDAFNMPWSARQTYQRTRAGGLEEAICAENNIASTHRPPKFRKADKPDF